MTAAPDPRRSGVIENTLIVGNCPAIKRAVAMAQRFAPSELPIILRGPTGTGKELFARAIHEWSARPGPLVDINCAALPIGMVDSLLFGHHRGAYTGAYETVTGLVESAHQGTLFLDELVSLPAEAQAKLLRVLETGEVRRVGETGKRISRFRAVATVNGDLEEALRVGQFRLDLLQRLAGVVIELPRLVQRGDDVLLLAEAFASRHGRRIASEAEHVLVNHAWPGNIRELRAVIDRCVYLSGGIHLYADTIREAIELGSGSISLGHHSLEGRGEGPLTRERVLSICAANNWDASRSASALGVRRTKLFALLRDFGISLRHARSRSGPLAS